MKFTAEKNYLNIDELRDICEAFNLPTDGLKTQLVSRILNFTSKKNIVDDDSVGDSVSDDVEGDSDVPKKPNQLSQRQSNRDYLKQIFFLIGGVVIGALLGYILVPKETIEVSINRPWF